MMLRFDEDTHAYYAGDRRIPGVTSLLKPLEDFYGIPPAVLERKAAIGKAVHYGCELIDQGELDWTSVHPQLEGYIRAYQRFLADTGFRVELSETRVYHAGLQYAGTLDRTGWLQGIKTLVDLKTVCQMSPATGCQTAAYLEALKASQPRDYSPPTDRYGLQLRKDGTYRLHPYRGTDDWPTFVSLLTIHNFQRKHGLTP